MFELHNDLRYPKMGKGTKIMGLDLVKRETGIKQHACSCPFVSIIQLRVSVEL